MRIIMIGLRATKSIVASVLCGSVLFGVAVPDAEAVVKVLVNSRHAYSSVGATINTLLGSGHVGTDIIVHSTNLLGNGGYTACCTAVFNTSGTVYNESGAAVASQAPYQIYTSSFAVTTGDSVSLYNQYDGVDFTHNLAFTTSINNAPPTFYTAPGGNNYVSKPGVEWRLDGSEFSVGTTLSTLTAANAGLMATLRYEHTTWNWFDVKAALRQTGTNWATGYDATDYGFGNVYYASSTILADNEILLQAPSVATSTTAYGQYQFTVYPFKQTRRAKEVLFQFDTNPGFQANELTLAEVQALGGVKITEYASTSATTTAPIFDAFTNDYFAWLTADDADDDLASFSRIDTYSILGPYTQSRIDYTSSFTLSSPGDYAAASTTPTFSWSAPTTPYGSLRYQLYIDGVLDTDNITGTSTTPASALSEGAHTWYVQALNGNDVATTSVVTRNVHVVAGYDPGYTFYVDNVLGDDDNPGTQAAPWATIAKARQVAGPGDTVILVRNEGSPYREELSTLSQTATASQRITFRGASTTTKAEIWGSDDVSDNWSAYGGGNADTYQRTLATEPSVVATGPSIADLTKRTHGASVATLNPGEWYWASNVLYYRLAAGEDINTLHVEAGARNYGIYGARHTTYQNLVVRYANTAGVYANSTTNTHFLGVEAYDSTRGFHTSFTTSVLMRDCIAARNDNEGIKMVFSTSITVHRCLAYGNGTHGVSIEYSAPSGSIKNNLITGNGSRALNFTSPSSMNGFSADYNVLDGAWHSSYTAYRGTGNTESVTPIFLGEADGNFKPDYLSPAIDAGTTISGVTTDMLGNPIYGTPDAGPYEYQPPYTVGTHRIPIGTTARVYADGKYRPTTATSTADTADLRVTPSGGFGTGDYSEWMNIAVSTWQTDGAYRKVWTESSSIATTTAHTVGDLTPGGQYRILVDGVEHSRATANASGEITFDYGGGYSTHTFEVNEAVIQGGIPEVGTSSGGQSTLPDPKPVATTATSTAITTATTTLPALPPTREALQTKIRALQEQLLTLLEQLVVVLMGELQKAGKSI